MIVIPDPLPRGVHRSRFYRHGRLIVLVAVSSQAECLDHICVGTTADLHAGTAYLTGLLDALDPLPGAPPSVPTAPSRLCLVR